MAGVPHATPVGPPEPTVEAGLVAVFRAHYLELVQLAAVFVDDVALCEELVQNAFVRLPGLGVTDVRRLAALRSMVLSAARAAVGRPGARPTAAIDAFRSLDREQAEAVVLHHHLGLELEEVAATLGIPVRRARRAVRRGLEAWAVASATQAAQS